MLAKLSSGLPPEGGFSSMTRPLAATTRPEGPRPYQELAPMQARSWELVPF